MLKGNPMPRLISSSDLSLAYAAKAGKLRLVRHFTKIGDIFTIDDDSGSISTHVSRNEAIDHVHHVRDKLTPWLDGLSDFKIEEDLQTIDLNHEEDVG